MQKSNFEKQVRDQLEELHFRPSAPVWDHIANNIRRRRRRRVLAYFSILALLITGAGFAYLYRTESAGQPDPVAQNESATPKNHAARQRESVPPENNSFTNDQPSSAGRPTRMANSEETSENQRPTKELPVTTYSSNRQRTEHSSAEPKRRNAAPDAAADLSSDLPASPVKAMPSTTPANTTSANALPLRREKEYRITNPSADPAPALPGDSGKVALNRDVVYDMSLNDAATDHLANLSAESLPVHQDSTQQSVHDNTIAGKWKKRSWEWGIEVGAGAGYRRNQSLPGVDESKDARADLTMGSLLQAGQLTNSLAVLRYFPSQSNEGFGWSIGFTARKEIASHVRFSAGLRYNYQSDRIRVGEMQSAQGALPSYIGVTGSGSPVYLGPQNQTFTNRYHLIQLPVGLEVQLNKGLKTPISWEAGLAPGYLLATQARVYDKAYYGIYYEDPAQFRRFQVAATTGFSVELRNKQKHRLVLGPELRLSLTPLADNAYDNQQYLIYGGLRARLYLP